MFPNYNEYVADEYKRFFLSSFVMLGFNHIDGDCIEFGCCGAVTLSIAYFASRYNGAPGRHRHGDLPDPHLRGARQCGER